MSFAAARALADAVLLEGYLLYPYRADSAKNRYRWTFGVVSPVTWAHSGSTESCRLSTDFLVRGDCPALRGRLRFLQIRSRRILARRGEHYEPTSALDVNGTTLLSWEDGELREIDFDVRLTRACVPQITNFALPGGESEEPLLDVEGTQVGMLHFSWSELCGNVQVRCESLQTQVPLYRVSLTVENQSIPTRPDASRSEVMMESFASTHVLIEVNDGEFVSRFEPPPFAQASAVKCQDHGLYPILAGQAGSKDLLLCSPIILYDHAGVAKESTGELFDSTEIDEILTLRTLALTSEEKSLARVNDVRARALLDRVEAMVPEQLAKLHGAIRERHGFSVGDRVRLVPGTRRTDAQDLLFAGRTATIARIEQDIEGEALLAVILDDDPAGDLHRSYGRFHYYRVDEVELVSVAPPRDPSRDPCEKVVES